MPANTFTRPRRVAYIAGGLAVFVGLNNLYGLLRPLATMEQLGFPTASTAADQDLVNGITRMFAATRIAGALAQLAACYYGAYEVLAWQMASGVLMAVVDGYVSKQVIGKGEWGHWGAVPISLGLSLYFFNST